ncbi:M15 family metallopeptidase [Corallincola spongiicola]|uniref:M15 family metallopeptidase n=1 Tax=Corallincola spongiicola TaxID=2520508 RepID=UPI001FECE53F|nr:M15 family metallopeptidase [Corallincola spongiicola]
MLTELHDRQLTGESESHLRLFGQRGTLVHKDVCLPLQSLISAAADDGFSLQIASGFRSFERQQAIWQAKFLGTRPLLNHDSQPLDITTLSESEKIAAILHWSALPGTSRHHWGTDLDIFCSLQQGEQPLRLEPDEYALGGPQHSTYLWLREHAGKFGFFWPYNTYRGGVAEEPWHISYGEIAEQALSQLTSTKVMDALTRNQVIGLAHLGPQIEALMVKYVTNVAHWPNNEH